MADDVPEAPPATLSQPRCPRCHGTGYVTEQVTETCYCGGSNWCPTCGGKGYYQKSVKRVCYH